MNRRLRRGRVPHDRRQDEKGSSAPKEEAGRPRSNDPPFAGRLTALGRNGFCDSQISRDVLTRAERLAERVAPIAPIPMINIANDAGSGTALTLIS